MKLLARHYGLSHKMVLRYLNERAGNVNSEDEAILKTFETTESNREACPLCSSNFAGRYMLLRHLADCHFRERLCQGMQTGDVYKCSRCNHESKDKGGFVRHYGLVHKMVQKWLKEMGIHGYDDENKKSVLTNRQRQQQALLKQQQEQQRQNQHLQQESVDVDVYQQQQRQPQNYQDPYCENPNSFPPSTPSSTTSYIDQVPHTVGYSTGNNQYYSSPQLLTLNSKLQATVDYLRHHLNTLPQPTYVRPPSLHLGRFPTHR